MRVLSLDGCPSLCLPLYHLLSETTPRARGTGREQAEWDSDPVWGSSGQCEETGRNVEEMPVGWAWWDSDQSQTRPRGTSPFSGGHTGVLAPARCSCFARLLEPLSAVHHITSEGSRAHRPVCPFLREENLEAQTEVTSTGHRAAGGSPRHRACLRLPPPQSSPG